MQNERKRPAFTKLTQSQFFKLCQYLKDNKARAEKHHWGATEAARFATSELKFQIGYQSVARAIKTLKEVDPESAPILASRKESSHGPGAPTNRRLEAMYQATRRQNACIRIIAKFIEGLDPDTAFQIKSVLNSGALPEWVKQENQEERESTNGE